MSDNSKPLRCIAHPGCQYPHCYCQVDPPLENQPKEKVDIVSRDLQRASISLGQFQMDLKDAEVANSILTTGIQDLIKKYTHDGIATGNLALRLLSCNVIKDLEDILNVSEQTSADIISKTQQ